MYSLYVLLFEYMQCPDEMLRGDVLRGDVLSSDVGSGASQDVAGTLSLQLVIVLSEITTAIIEGS